MRRLNQSLTEKKEGIQNVDSYKTNRDNTVYKKNRTSRQLQRESCERLVRRVGVEVTGVKRLDLEIFKHLKYKTQDAVASMQSWKKNGRTILTGVLIAN